MTRTAASPHRLRWILLALVLMPLLVPSAHRGEVRASESNEVLAITHVNVVPMDAEHVLEDRTVLVTKGTISALGHARDVVVPKGPFKSMAEVAT